jgi:hypothetical protein
MVSTDKNKTFIGIGIERIELTGDELQAFEADRKVTQDAQTLLEAEQLAKQTARANAIQKLAEIAGLTEEEINSIL